METGGASGPCPQRVAVEQVAVAAVPMGLSPCGCAQGVVPMGLSPCRCATKAVSMGLWLIRALLTLSYPPPRSHSPSSPAHPLQQRHLHQPGDRPRGPHTH